MEHVIRRYRHLSYELAIARKVIKEIESDIKTLPKGCPVQKYLRENLATANELRRDIQSDINNIADNELGLNLKLLV